MADCAPVMVWMAGTDKLCDFFNEGWLRFTGRSMAQEIGDGWAEGVHADDVQRCLDIYFAAFEAREAFRMEYRLRRHDGVHRWILDSGAPRFDAAGIFVGYIGSCIDIHDYRESQDHLRQVVADKEALLKELNHRVKNNLQMILSYITLRLSRITHAETRDEMRHIVERITSLALIHQQLSASEKPSRIDFQAFIRELMGVIVSGQGRPEVTLIVDVGPLTLSIGRAVPMALIVNELVGNCYRHAFPNGQGGEIRLTLRTDADEATVLSVTDTGVGFPTGVAAWTAGAVGLGGGLGLRIVELLAGQAGAGLAVTVQDGAQNGAQVRLLLTND